MKPYFSRLLVLGAFITSVRSAYGHPGHDDHEFTWDLGHLAANPLATLGCIAVLLGAAWLGWQWRKSALAVRRVRVMREDRNRRE